MRRFSAFAVITLAALLSISICSAQQTATTSVPNLIRYSGTLKDAQGAALSSSTAVGVTFSIYQQQDGGAAVWTETQNVTPDANGQYNVILGSTTATGLPDDLFSQQEQRWLGVQVQGEAEQTRVLLVSVPYAFKAHEAETLGGLPASAFVQAAPSNASGTGSTGTGTAVNALGNVLRAGGISNGKGAAFPAPCPSVTASTDPPNVIPMWDLSSTCILTNSLMFQDAMATVVTDIGNFNLANPPRTPPNSYQISGTTVLAVSPGGVANLALSSLLVGAGAGVSATGFNNTFVGYQAGNINTGETSNTYTGSMAGGMASGSSMNSFYGYMAGYKNQSVIGGNSFFGYNAGMMNGSGSDNTFMGYRAGSSNIDGTDNTFIGYQAGADNSEGQKDNTYIGSNTGGTSGNGTKNVFVGSHAGNSDSDGHDNVFIGFDAGMANVGGSSNTYIGSGAANGITGDNNIYIGTGDYGGTISNQIRIGNSTFQSAVIYGIYGSSAGNSSALVCTASDGRLGTTNCPRLADLQARQLVAAQQDVIKTQQEQIQTQGQQIADLQQRLSRLESLIEKK